MLMSLLLSLLGRDLWLQILGQTELFFAVVIFSINLVVMTIVFYLAGIIVVGKRRAILTDAFVISLLGTIVSSICSLIFPPVIGLLLSLLVWLLLIRRYYETGWMGALAVAVLAVIIYVVVWVILAFLFAIPILLLFGLASL
ncbi:MAG: hypothetical protein NWE97_00350 [Candidatus Bathyarchaeota archaeon]|nr:hypothetical protein [Candidatus Bathyarchaeota archaeon]